MTEPLPTNVDLIVIGTGLTESIVAAAASRIGKTVLHLDTNEYYGGYWTSFNLSALINYANRCNDGCVDNSSILNVKMKWLCPEKFDDTENVEAETKEEWCQEKVLKEFRKFNIDLSPKLLFARGNLVELLISSNICRYSEFRAVDHVITLHDDTLKTVPCSRADVFSSKEINVVEKRLLMKLLTICLSYEENNVEFSKYLDQPYIDYLKENNLTPKLIHYILYAIAMGNETIKFQDGIERTKTFLSSLGRYGNTPFLFPMYGCGEIPQCFCRLCSVFGGVYCLRRNIEDINVEETEDGKSIFKRIKCEEQLIEGNHLIVGSGIATKLLKSNDTINVEMTSDQKCGNLSRGIFISTKPLGNEELNKGGGGVMLLKIPSDDISNDGAFIIQLSHFSGTCPKGLYLFHFITKTIIDAEIDLKPYIKKLFNCDTDNIPGIIWSLYFTIPPCLKCNNLTTKIPDAVSFCCGPYFELDYNKSIDEAMKTFKTIYPNEEFLPRAPDPEEIIIGGGDEDDDEVEGEEAEEEGNIVEKGIEVDDIEKGQEPAEDEIEKGTEIIE